MINTKYSLIIFSISNLQAFKNLKTLSLGRNNLKSLQGIEATAETLEQLWISYNQVNKLRFMFKGDFWGELFRTNNWDLNFSGTEFQDSFRLLIYIWVWEFLIL